MALKFIPMKCGEKGTRVEKAQIQLAKAGSTIKPNAVYTIGMVSAVKAFQKKNGLKVTGVIDQKTWTALSAVKAPRKTVKMAGKK